jgi:hypothetical protein
MRLDIDASTTAEVGDGIQVLGEFNPMIANSRFHPTIGNFWEVSIEQGIVEQG